jgi:hypothetical protein
MQPEGLLKMNTSQRAAPCNVPLNARNDDACTRKLRYASPTLATLGTVAELTRGMNGSAIDGDGLNTKVSGA